ncbi:MAG: hypothetical protein ACPMAG_09760 [Limisphaerales bacterium]|jgi:hypothetical protein
MFLRWMLKCGGVKRIGAACQKWNWVELLIGGVFNKKAGFFS